MQSGSRKCSARDMSAQHELSSKILAMYDSQDSARTQADQRDAAGLPFWMYATYHVTSIGCANYHDCYLCLVQL